MLPSFGHAAGFHTQHPTITLFSASASATGAITVPGGTREGDLLILVDAAVQAGSHPGLAVPAGWTFATTIQGGGVFSRLTLSCKIATSGDLVASHTGQSGSVMAKTMAVVRAVWGAFDTVSASDVVAGTNVGGTGGSIISATNGATWPTLQVAGYYATDGAGVSAAMSPAQDFTITAFGQSPVHIRVLDQQGGKWSDVTVTMNDVTSPGHENMFVGASLILRPAGFCRLNP